MPITLPNTGLVCPEQGDPNAQACQQIKALFTHVDSLPTNDNTVQNPCVDLFSANWAIETSQNFDSTCRQFKQTIIIPLGVDPFKSNMTIIDEQGCVVNLEIEVISQTSLCVRTNTPGNYQLVFS